MLSISSCECVPTSTDSSADFERDLSDALNKGAYVVLNITKVLTTGAATAGKICTKHYIFDKPPPDQYTIVQMCSSQWSDIMPIIQQLWTLMILVNGR